MEDVHVPVLGLIRRSLEDALRDAVGYSTRYSLSDSTYMDSKRAVYDATEGAISRAVFEGTRDAYLNPNHAFNTINDSDHMHSIQKDINTYTDVVTEAIVSSAYATAVRATNMAVHHAIWRAISMAVSSDAHLVDRAELPSDIEHADNLTLDIRDTTSRQSNHSVDGITRDGPARAFHDVREITVWVTHSTVRVELYNILGKIDDEDEVERIDLPRVSQDIRDDLCHTITQLIEPRIIEDITGVIFHVTNGRDPIFDMNPVHASIQDSLDQVMYEVERIEQPNPVIMTKVTRKSVALGLETHADNATRDILVKQVYSEALGPVHHRTHNPIMDALARIMVDCEIKYDYR